MTERLTIVAFAARQLGEPYVWGVEGPPVADLDEWDCSELIEHAYAHAGKIIPDGVVNQYPFFHKRPIEPLPADLGFLHYWSRKTGNECWHVGVVTDRSSVIHASLTQGHVVEEPMAKFSAREGFLGWGRHPDYAA